MKIRKYLVADEGTPIAVYDDKEKAIRCAEKMNAKWVREYAADQDIDIDDLDDPKEYAEIAFSAEQTVSVYPFFLDQVKEVNDTITLTSLNGEEEDFWPDDIRDMM